MRHRNHSASYSLNVPPSRDKWAIFSEDFHPVLSLGNWASLTTLDFHLWEVLVQMTTSFLSLSSNKSVKGLASVFPARPFRTIFERKECGYKPLFYTVLPMKYDTTVKHPCPSLNVCKAHSIPPRWSYCIYTFSFNDLDLMWAFPHRTRNSSVWQGSQSQLSIRSSLYLDDLLPMTFREGVDEIYKIYINFFLHIWTERIKRGWGTDMWRPRNMSCPTQSHTWFMAEFSCGFFCIGLSPL